jgi:hypothetical protein
VETFTEVQQREALRAHVRASLANEVEPIKCSLPAANDELSEADVDEEVRRIETEAAYLHANSRETQVWQAEQREERR